MRKRLLFGAAILLTVAMAFLAFVRIKGAYKYPMEWEKAEVSNAVERAEIEEELAVLGFPRNVAKDLTIEDLQECKGAVAVEVAQELYAMNDGHLEVKKEGVYLSNERVVDDFELQLTSIAVQLSDEGLDWKVIHHFEWVEDVEFVGTEAISAIRRGWQKYLECKGQVLYDEDGITYVSPYAAVEWQSEEEVHYAAFSFPKGKERCRGYISYERMEWEEGWYLSAKMIYWHQKSWLQFPARTALIYAKGQYYDAPRVFSQQAHGVGFSTGSDR